MGLMPLLKEMDLSEEQEKLKAEFFDATGYGSSDLLSLSYITKTFLTRNGGKYQLNDDGSFKRLAGPPLDVEDRWEF